MDSFERDISKQLADLKQGLMVIKANYATKADVLEAKTSLIMWIIGLGLFTQVAPIALKSLFG